MQSGGVGLESRKVSENNALDGRGSEGKGETGRGGEGASRKSRLYLGKGRVNNDEGVSTLDEVVNSEVSIKVMDFTAKLA